MAGPDCSFLAFKIGEMEDEWFTDSSVLPFFFSYFLLQLLFEIVPQEAKSREMVYQSDLRHDQVLDLDLHLVSLPYLCLKFLWEVEKSFAQVKANDFF